MRELLRIGAGALMALTIMFVGSLGLWLGTPLLWLWVGSQIQGDTSSLSLALLVMAVGVLVTVWLAAKLLVRLSEAYRANAVARGLPDPGHRVLESVLIAAAGLAILVFGVWFLLFAGASPVPLGMNL
jgi:hypothetical protein